MKSKKSHSVIIKRIGKKLEACATACIEAIELGKTKEVIFNLQKFQCFFRDSIGSTGLVLSTDQQDRISEKIEEKNISRKGVINFLEGLSQLLHEFEVNIVTASLASPLLKNSKDSSRIYPDGWDFHEDANAISIHGIKFYHSENRYTATKTIAISHKEGSPGITQKSLFRKAFQREQKRNPNTGRISETLKTIFYDGKDKERKRQLGEFYKLVFRTDKNRIYLNSKAEPDPSNFDLLTQQPSDSR